MRAKSFADFADCKAGSIGTVRHEAHLGFHLNWAVSLALGRTIPCFIVSSLNSNFAAGDFGPLRLAI
jgi:hypothetical protein